MFQKLFRRLFRKGYPSTWPVIGSSEWHRFLRNHRFLIDVCLKKNADFYWAGPGALLIKRSGLEEVVREAIERGFVVEGFEAFSIDNESIYQHIGAVADFTGTDDGSDSASTDPLKVIATWPQDIWVDVAGYLPDWVEFE